MLTPEQVQAQEAALRQRDTELRYLRTQLVSADGEVVVERAAREELEAQLRASQAELGRVRDQLAFYEQLLPPGPAGAIDIRGAEFARVGNDLRYRVLMMRSGRSESPFSGELRFVANGIQQGQTVSVELQPQRVKTEESAAPGAVLPAAAGGAVEAATPAAVSADPANGSNGNGGNLLAVHFDHFQRSQGVLALPEGFVPRASPFQCWKAATFAPRAKCGWNFEARPGCAIVIPSGGRLPPLECGLPGQECEQ
ncbi:integral membrane protein [Bordetella trematum]|nr:integral membrane protein [Bordetella trematum]